jgi:hypothetical protein
MNYLENARRWYTGARLIQVPGLFLFTALGVPYGARQGREEVYIADAFSDFVRGF